MSIANWPNRLGFTMPRRTARVVFGCALAAGLLAGERTAAEPGFLAGGGSISVGGGIYSSGSSEFLEDGGSISIERRDRGHRRQREFLNDGGSITSGARRAFHRHGERQREFLEDGGSISSGADRAFHRRGHRDDRRRDSFLRRGGSVTTVYDVAPRHRDDRPAISDIGQRTSRSDGVRYRGDDDTGDHGGYRGGGYAVATSYGTSPGPKVIDVDRARLDRRPVAPRTVEIVHAGGAKIIRVAPDYRLQTASVPRTEPAPRAAALEPWTRDWLRHCMQAYPSFEPNFGTYRAPDGRNRFCTGE